MAPWALGTCLAAPRLACTFAGTSYTAQRNSLQHPLPGYCKQAQRSGLKSPLCRATDYNDPAFFSADLTVRNLGALFLDGAGVTHPSWTLFQTGLRAEILGAQAHASGRFQFDHALYWDERYRTEASTFEWYRSFESIAPLIERHISKAGPVLHVGVGTSTLQEDMAAVGYKHIVNVDYSRVCIDLMLQRQASRSPIPDCKLDYAVADCRDMPQFASGCFQSVVDKGTLDALLCADDDVGNASAMLKEVARVLQPGGVYMWCTSGSPQSRLPYFEAFGPCKLEIYEVGQQGKRVGPFDRATALDQLPAMKYSHFVYVLSKA